MDTRLQWKLSVINGLSSTVRICKTQMIQGLELEALFVTGEAGVSRKEGLRQNLGKQRLA